MLPPFLSLPNSFPSRPLPAIRGNPSQSESAPQADPGSPRNSQPPSELIRSNPSQSEANRGIQAHAPLPERRKYFLPYQIQWLDDESPLRIMEKSRQVGVSYADAYD